MSQESLNSEQNIVLPNVDDVREAATRLSGKAIHTPLLESEDLNARTGARILIKPEVLQVTGSFKFRGAYNNLCQLSEEERKHGVIACSSGNHAQGVAAASKKLGIRATIVMPEDAPKLKLERTRGHGAEIVLFDRYKENREQLVDDIAKKTGAIIIPPYDDPNIISGQGTVGLELCNDMIAQGLTLDMFLAPAGGGGLIAGCGLAIKSQFPDCKMYCVEPEGYDDHARSLVSGQREISDVTRSNICDALLTPQPGELTFSLNQRALEGGFSVSEDEVRSAMAYAFEELKLVVEPGGAVALAALLAGKVKTHDSLVGIVLSGGNVSTEDFNNLTAGQISIRSLST